MSAISVSWETEEIFDSEEFIEREMALLTQFQENKARDAAQRARQCRIRQIAEAMEFIAVSHSCLALLTWGKIIFGTILFQ
jgi:hypothetical protein